MKTLFARSTTGLLLILGLCMTTVVAAPTASASVRVQGTVMCSSQAPVAGVWIKAEKGGSGWAKVTNVYKSGASYNKRFEYRLPKGGRYQVHVGCGWKDKNFLNKTQVWKTTNKGPYVTRNHNFTCFDAKGVKYLPRSGQVYPYEKCIVS